jgi:hypothetical protein
VQEVDGGMADCALAVTCDRTSNGPHIYYPNPTAPGGIGLFAGCAAGDTAMAVMVKVAER